MIRRNAPAPSLERHLADGRALLDRELSGVVPPLGTPPAVLHGAMRYTLLLPGKRLRGILVLDACDLVKGERARAVPLACAVEMVHASSLILDDLPCMDGATLRRGKPTLHREVGEANAILASVALLNAAFAVVLDAEGLKERERVEAARRLASAVGSEGLVGGQVADLAATGKRIELEELEYVHSHKTGALFIAAAELGALAGRARARETEGLSRYAKNLGLAFQITDDLLDYSGDPSKTGKDAGLDRDRTTFVNLSGIDGARRLVDDLIDAAVEALGPFGKRAARLVAMAEMVRERDR